MTVNPLRAGLSFGALLGLVHLAWAVTVALGAAQTVVDFVFRMHFIQPLAVLPFDIGMAAVLVIVTALVGFLLGYVFAFIWNGLHQETAVRRSVAAR